MEKESNFAIFVYEKQDQDLIDQLSTYLDSKAKNICMFFDVNTPFKNPTIKIIPTKEEYDNLKNTLLKICEVLVWTKLSKT